MRLRTTLLISVTVVAATVPASEAGFRTPRSCSDGSQVFREGRIRLFTIRGSVDGYPIDRYFLCSRWLRTPKRIYQTEESYDTQLFDFSVAPRRLVLGFDLSGGESFDQGLAWFHLRKGIRRTTFFSDRQEGPYIRRIVGDERGGIAYLQDGDDDEYPAQRIGYARLRETGRLGRPRVRAMPHDVLPRSLAVADGVITWRTRSGEPGSVSTEG